MSRKLCRAAPETEIKVLKWDGKRKAREKPRRQLTTLKILVLAKILHGTWQVAPCGLDPPVKC